MNEPDDRIWLLLRGFMASWALLVAVQLRVPDALADGPRRVEDLAAAGGADPDVLYRLLRALAAEGVFREQDARTFAGTEVSEALREGAGPWRDAVLTYGPAMRAFAEVPDVVRAGGAPFERAFGRGYWEWLERDPELSAAFNRLMQSGAEHRVELVAALPWSDETVVDVGGGNGTLLIELLRRHPALRGVVLDRPDVAEEAEQRIREAGLAKRIEVVPGSFFESVPPADAYVLAKVLHDWDDDEAARILATVRGAAPSGARLVVVDEVIGDRGSDDDSTWTDLVMLALVRGRERTAADWRALLEPRGFRVTRTDEELVEALAV